MPDETRSGKWSDIFTGANNRIPSTVGEINRLPGETKRKIYTRLIPEPIYSLFSLSRNLFDEQGRDLLELNCPAGAAIAEMSLFHEYGFPDPVVYGQITDTLNGQIHVLLYIINDPTSERFAVDRLPDGTPTKFGVLYRNIPAEIEALQAGLAPGQIRRGLRLMSNAVDAFEAFARLLGHDRFFSEPLFYHNAVILERAGFAYLKGKRLMEEIDRGFQPDGVLSQRLDGSTPFRQPEAAESIRLRSWALHDGLAERFFNDVTMYKVVGKTANIQTTTHLSW